MPEWADILEIRLRLFVQRFGHCAGDIGGLVEPASLFTGRGKNIAQGRPEPKRTVANGELWRHRQTALLQPVQ